MLKNFTLLAICLLNAILIFAQPPANQIWTTPAPSGSPYYYVAPSAFTALVEVWGGGASGVSGTASQGARSGGGGGAYAAGTLSILYPSTTGLQVGRGGLGATSQPGVISYFGSNIIADHGYLGVVYGTAAAGPGLGGDTSSSSQTKIPAGGTKRPGGDGGFHSTGAAFGSNKGGGGGGASGSKTVGGTNGADGINPTGGAAGVTGAEGGNGGTGGDINQNGSNGVYPGGGGGGKGDKGAASGDGRDGMVRMTVLTTTPIKLISYDAIKYKKNAIIKWETATEDPHDKFEIFRSVDGINWEKIGAVSAIGAGNNKYSFTDTKTLPGINFYYLNVLETSGNAFSTSIEKLDFKTITSLVTVFPNPASNQLQIKLPNGQGNKKYVIIGNDGTIHTIAYINEGVMEKTIDVSKYPSGKYIMLVFNENNIDTEKIKFIIVR